MQTISIPTINDAQCDYLQLVQIGQRVIGDIQGARLNFSYCHFLRPNAVAFLGGVARVAQSRGIPVVFDWNSVLNQAVMMNLCQNGFAQRFGHASNSWSGHSIPYREDGFANFNSVLDYLTDQWLGRGWVHVSEPLRDAIVGKVWEIYTNSFEHGQSHTGVFSCGQHFSNMNELMLSVVDFGTGIPNKVRGFLSSDPRSQNILSSACLGWAFQRGNSTSVAQGVPRGLGLDLLKDFVKINDGSLEVYSNNGYALINRYGEFFSDLGFDFPGTAVQIKIKCDERLYHLGSSY